ncbi:MAG: hypothetical protein QM813_23085 [Verrucomicrobiota bacterium]
MAAIRQLTSGECHVKFALLESEIGELLGCCLGELGNDFLPLP